MRRERIVVVPRFDSTDFLRRSGAAGNDELEREALALLLDCGPLARPKALLCEVAVEPLEESRIRLGGEVFESRCLTRNLDGLDATCAFVATCGEELEECAADGDGLRAYWVDVVKEMALEAVTVELEQHSAGWYHSEGVAMMNPGSADVDVWPLEEQLKLFRLLGDARAEIGVELTESLLMVPNKSVSGVLFPSHQGWVSCEVCTRAGCPSRRAPFSGNELSAGSTME